MIITEFNKDIPEWLYPHMMKRCPYCTGHIVDMGDVENGVMKLTQRKCINPACKRHVAHRLLKVVKFFGIEGIGPSKAEEILSYYNLQNHLEAIPILLKGVKPKVYLHQVGELSQVYGMDRKWQDLLKGYSSFDEYFHKAYNIPDIVIANKEYLKFAETFFDVKEPLSSTAVNIMMSGSIDGFSNRKDFVEYMNNIFGSVIQVRDVGKRASGVNYLVKEPHTSDHSKTGIALNNNIPIVSSSEFVKIISNEYVRITENLDTPEHIEMEEEGE